MSGQPFPAPPEVLLWTRTLRLQAPLIVSIVDDDENVRLATCSLLRSLGCKTRDYASAEAFLCADGLEEVSCVISDLQMPGMDGIEMQRRLKDRASAPPIIFISAFGSDIRRREALANGALCFLDKPVDSDALLACLGQLGRDGA
jgi:FixJ family two-component response regulator